MIEIKTVYELIEKEGFGRFNSQTFVDFIKLRLTISHKAAKIFQTCQQHSIGFRVQVRSSDYQLVSKLDPRCSLTKISVLLHKYYDQMAKLKNNTKGGAPDSQANKVAHFEGHYRLSSPQLNPKCVQELVEETHYLLSLETFLMKMFNFYKVRQDTDAVNDGAVLDGRTVLFHHVGRAALKSGDALLKLRHVHATMRTTMTQEARDGAVAEAMKGAFAAAETAYRRALLAANAIQETDMPAPKYPAPVKAGAQPTNTEAKTAPESFKVTAVVDGEDTSRSTTPP